MRKVLPVALLVVVAAAGPLAAQQPAPADAMKAGPVTSAAAVHWGPAPAVLPAGAQMAVLYGDPSQAGTFIMRLRFPDGYAIAPHHHPSDERLTILQGTFHVGMGDKVDRPNMLAIAQGGFVPAPANQNHYAWAQGETIVQIESTGPFQLVYANPADDPSTKK